MATGAITAGCGGASDGAETNSSATTVLMVFTGQAPAKHHPVVMIFAALVIVIVTTSVRSRLQIPASHFPVASVVVVVVFFTATGCAAAGVVWAVAVVPAMRMAAEIAITMYLVIGALRTSMDA